MPDHKGISYPAKWVEATDEKPGYWQPSYQEHPDLTPEEVAQQGQSITGRFLAAALEQQRLLA